eukprot:CAMPEP_0117420704 /NCGR_PEP_ID=MMETSP0758-20121206/1980_1 /TAXON_ID=63605 /ORGANISM="Percolomonas cosmopolitus, Strain AE-1 (ATCC 50343)" /LENGTH=430 /DNA_ID=CAMNT_0005202463 /DNA_START=173 /DNA_END=1462 /DNA_ORIENTATION=-
MHSILEKLPSHIGSGSTTIGVGVSGGPDSMACAYLLNEFCKNLGIKLKAIIVNHNVRPGMMEEIIKVKKWLNAHNIEYETKTISWEARGGRPSHQKQTIYRKERYKLFNEFCMNNDIHLFATAHHQGDNLESFVHRIGLQSGLKGLNSMPDISSVTSPTDNNYQISYIKPLLALSKEEIKEILRDINQPWIEDPSNEDTNDLRVSIRKFLETHFDEKESKMLSESLSLFYETENVLQEQLYNIASFSYFNPIFNFLALPKHVLHSTHIPEYTVKRFLITCIETLRNEPYYENHSGLNQLVNNLMVKQKSASLGGCLFEYIGNNLVVTRDFDRKFIKEFDGVDGKYDLFHFDLDTLKSLFEEFGDQLHDTEEFDTIDFVPFGSINPRLLPKVIRNARRYDPLPPKVGQNVPCLCLKTTFEREFFFPIHLSW